MASLQCKTLSEMEKCKDPREVFDILLGRARQLGFDEFLYVTSDKPGVGRVGWASQEIDSYLPCYETEFSISRDPVFSNCTSFPLPYVWCRDLVSPTHSILEALDAKGVSIVWAKGLINASGRHDFFIFLSRLDDFNSGASLSINMKMLWLVQGGYSHLERIEQELGTRHQEKNRGLTEREIEILRWVAKGKTSSEVSIILGISGRTVNFHVGNILNKLHACNRTSALLKATSLGLI